MSKMKNIKIDEKVHEKLKEFCSEQGLKVGKFVEKLISSKLEEEQEK